MKRARHTETATSEEEVRKLSDVGQPQDGCLHSRVGGLGFYFQGVRRGTRNKFYGRENYKIRNKEKRRNNEEKMKNLKSLTKAFQESQLEENQWSLTIEGCNLAMKENIILFINSSL